MAVARKIAYNVIFNVITKILSTILALVGIGFITRYLGKDGFGDYSTVLAFFAFFGAVADLGIYSITAREISRPGANEEKILGNAFALRIVTAAIVLLFIPFFVYFLPYSFSVKLGIFLVALSFIFSSTYSVLNGVFQKNLAMDKIALAEVCGKIIQVVIIIFAVKKNLGFDAIILSILIAMIFNFTVVIILVKKFVKLKLQFDFSYWKKFLKESLPMGISAIIIFVYFKMDTIMLSVMKTNTEVGIYNAAYKVIENITFFPAMIIGLVFPMLSKNIFFDTKKFTHIANETAKVFLILIVPLVIGTLFLSNGIINLIGGNSFSQSAPTLRILVFALACIFYGGFFNSILIAANMQKKLMYGLLLCAIFNVTANFFIIPIYSYNGAAIVSFLTEALVVSISFYLTVKHTKYIPKISHFFRIFLSGIIMAIFLFIFKNFLGFLSLALLSSLIYIAALWVTQTITIRELRTIFVSK
jgi:O-antigen/teichoic acid export membrane protein